MESTAAGQISVAEAAINTITLFHTQLLTLQNETTDSVQALTDDIARMREEAISTDQRHARNLCDKMSKFINAVLEGRTASTFQKNIQVACDTKYLDGLIHGFHAAGTVEVPQASRCMQVAIASPVYAHAGGPQEDIADADCQRHIQNGPKPPYMAGDVAWLRDCQAAAQKLNWDVPENLPAPHVIMTDKDICRPIIILPCATRIAADDTATALTQQMFGETHATFPALITSIVSARIVSTPCRRNTCCMCTHRHQQDSRPCTPKATVCRAGQRHTIQGYIHNVDHCEAGAGQRGPHRPQHNLFAGGTKRTTQPNASRTAVPHTVSPR